ncbi:MAG: hypothetical protein GY754_32505 [bacterium]|nr:hypothetical protein [bacterium]
MKKTTKIGFLSFILAIILTYTGCEEGLSSNSNDSNSNDGFSFSDMYTKFQLLKDEVNTVRERNQELEATINMLLTTTTENRNLIETNIVSIDGLMSIGNNKSGSHNIIVGSNHNYSSYGGLVVGYYNTISGRYSSVSGGYYNQATGWHSSVSGGWGQHSTGQYDWRGGGLFQDQ